MPLLRVCDFTSLVILFMSCSDDIRPRLPAGKSPCRGGGSTMTSTRTHSPLPESVKSSLPVRKPALWDPSTSAETELPHRGPPFLPRSFLLRCTSSNKNKPAGSGMKSECGEPDRSGVTHPANLHDGLCPLGWQLPCDRRFASLTLAWRQHTTEERLRCRPHLCHVCGSSLSHVEKR